ncbi:WD repeat-containing protein C10orf79 [Harpegnathos saltator]|uniref:Cilia- and flagella-associated protein 43 n=1 Tax=Harpegnathos saltator TaxID=610380 RepID=E2B325_HARSA|nr:WD repeat-containing protein C10orf79 [Harpegnathos saltator]
MRVIFIRVSCSPNPPHLVSQLAAADGSLSVYQVRMCSKIVSIHHVDVPYPEHRVVSSSWTPEGNLFVCDELGNVWLMAIEANKLYSVVKLETCAPPRNKPIVVAYRSGVILVNAASEITFYKKLSTNWDVSWQFVWSISTTYHSIRAAKRHSCKDGLLLHSKSGEIFEISIHHDNVPRVEVIYTDDMEYKALLSISQRADHVAAIDQLDRLCIFELSSGKLIARLSLRHHGEVERKPNPKISIFIYPTLQRISRCVLPDKINGYLFCYFAGTEYLVSLTTFPDFRIIVWHWKTGKHVAALNTKIVSLTQEISCSPNPPHLVSQLAAADGSLSVYQVRMCSKIVSIHHVDVPYPEHRVVSSSWTPEGNLFVCDELGNVWLMAIEANKLYSVVKLETCAPPRNKPIVVAYRSGVILVNAASEITFYKKLSTNWDVSWQFVWSISTTYHSIRAAKRHSCKDGLLLHSKSGEIFEISIHHDNVPRVEVIYTDDMEYKALLSISQRADHVAAIDQLDRLCIFELSSGKLIARLSLRHHGEVLRADSHPTLPMLASCNVAGSCIFVDVTSVSSPKIFSCFHLHRDPLDKMKFSRRGEFLALSNSRTGDIFIIGKPLKRQRADVVGHLEIGGHMRQLSLVVDFLVYERGDDRFEILVLVTANPAMAPVGGNKVIVYTCEISSDFCAHATCVIDLSRPFRMLYHGSSEPLGILGVPSLSKQLYQMEIQNDFQDVALTKRLFAVHQMRKIGMHVTESHVVTYGYDGLVVVRDSADLGRVLAILMPQHRSKGGVKSAIYSRLGETVVSLGRNGDLAANRVRLPETRANLVETEAASTRLSMEDFSYGPSELHGRETWLDSVIAAKLQAERDEALLERAAIVADLKRIKDQARLFEIDSTALSLLGNHFNPSIRELLDRNENKPPDVRLPISTFDLDRQFRQRKIEEARLEREELHRSLEEECVRRDQVVSYLREIFWTPLQVKPCALRSIGGDTKVHNYPLVASSRKTNDFKIWDRLSSDADEFVYSYELADDKDDSRRASLTSHSDDESSTADDGRSKVHEMAKKWYTSTDETEKSRISGVTTHNWIGDESLALTHQLLMPSNSNLETILSNDIMIESRERKLKVHFNDLFEEMRRSKERELKRAKERIERLRYCAAELKRMFGIDFSLGPIEMPTWSVDEIPDYAVTVDDREVLENRSRRGKCAVETVNKDHEDGEKGEGSNDFHMKALDKMMDGVLELSWEDEVKKEIPVPKCLIVRYPWKRTVKDTVVITVYKFKMNVLKRKREKYKAMLRTEIAETKEALQRDILAFNDKLKDLELKKMRIECAIFQERSIRMRAIRKHRAEADDRQKIARLRDQQLAPATQEARELAEECNSLETVVSEQKVRYDNLCKAEKRQEAKFRGEFADLKQPMVEHLLRHYKKRPRLGRLTTTSVTYLTEVARCIVSGDKSEILPRECLDFLRAMDLMDTMPGNLPPQININHWRMMCRLRRAKVELETKVRCCAVETAEAEQTLSFYQKAMQSADNAVACERAKLDNAEKTLARLAEKMEVQLVLKTGQIEVPLRGCPADYANAVLVTREELLRVNNCIVETGKRKLTAMHRSMYLRKVVLRHEWQHACAKMMLDDLQQELRDVCQFKITRNILEHLNNDPHNVNLEKDYEKMRANLRIFQNKFRGLVELEQTRLREAKLLSAKWRRKTDRISREIRSRSSDVEECYKMLKDPRREKNEQSRRMRLTMIARRTRLIMKVADNYEHLLILHARLEVLKLRTYPTLRCKT